MCDNFPPMGIALLFQFEIVDTLYQLNCEDWIVSEQEGVGVIVLIGVVKHA